MRSTAIATHSFFCHFWKDETIFHRTFNLIHTKVNRKTDHTNFLIRKFKQKSQLIDQECVVFAFCMCEIFVMMKSCFPFYIWHYNHTLWCDKKKFPLFQNQNVCESNITCLEHFRNYWAKNVLGNNICNKFSREIQICGPKIENKCEMCFGNEKKKATTLSRIL